ncbi:cyclic nucleotide-binding domain-containing protein [Enterococcus hulanensis]|uniref:Crp/Fnr family transcriptional regulator n=1 Tax=Enterococcus TaxID=1350 RepID=UPI000B5A3F30|nr:MULTISPECIES: cyclic nucleotide-binding domain-containing protein [Enterococcus]MBO0410187.1 cyclic nucleotide-binding domain-containing protein [Enterococcus hulanensis]OTO14648.1 hypothetical protein A5875_003805 [Enterococcus sp. 3H8_DIV0648]
MKKSQLNKVHETLLSKYGLSKESLKCCEHFQYNPGEKVWSEGDSISTLLLVLTGKAKICSFDSNGNNLILSYYVSSGLIGDVELMMNYPTATASVIAVSPFECISIPYKHNRKELLDNVVFMNSLAIDLSEKLFECTNSYVSNALKSGEQRLCSYILQAEYKGFFFDNYQDVAATIGMSYRHLMRLFKQLNDEGIIAKKNNGYQILKHQYLTEAIK